MPLTQRLREVKFRQKNDQFSLLSPFAC